MKNYVKQMCRRPLQLLLMIVLIMIVTVMLTVGGNLWVTSDRLSKAYENDFITIGTVSQKPDSVQESRVWDAKKQEYQIRYESVYDRYVMQEEINFTEAEYLVEPEKRVYWGSYAPEYLHASAEGGFDPVATIAEFSPMESGIPSPSKRIKVTRVLGSDKKLEGTVLWLCDHTNRYPVELKEEKTYIAMIKWSTVDTHGKEWEEKGYLSHLEYNPVPIETTLYTSEGKRIEDPLKMQKIYEVTDGFYETEIGRRYLEVADMDYIIKESQPVVGTNSTDLLPSFYDGSAWLYEGRYPTTEEYAQGSEVCLVPKEFADNNNLSVGDQVITRLYFTDAKKTPASIWPRPVGRYADFGILDLDGNPLRIFEEKNYLIVGIYDVAPFMADDIASDELIVPLNSIHKKMENIVEYGPMTDGNTSFRIKNGSISEFLEIIAKHDTDNLIFTFHDRGYSALMEGIRNLKNMSAILLIMGLIAAVILTLQISHIYITKQKKRLAVERLLGMTEKQCRNISLAGILILLLLGTVPGMAAGMAISNRANIEDMAHENFDRMYSNIGISAEQETDLSGQGVGDVAVSCMMGGLVIALGMTLSGVKLRKTLCGEPMYLMEEGMVEK
ncbi:MAG: hypothetical protein HDR16_01980 [Lachnospiraceae bacterium]|nr:hypothetical protein [Lachnospiraceae bacterium]